MTSPAADLAVAAHAPRSVEGRLPILDGWRAVSILFVLASHLLPLNRFVPGTNEATGALGMAIFFALSGFLITRFLMERPEPLPFLIRRLLRIVPLAWLTMFILVIWNGFAKLPVNLAFVANFSENLLFVGGRHLWSLGVEMQFYVAVALLVALFGRRGLFVLPLLAVLVTINRIVHGSTISMDTFLRIDEVLAGSAVALLRTGSPDSIGRRIIAQVPFPIACALAIASSFIHWPVAYIRPYAVALMVATTLEQPMRVVAVVLCSKVSRYLASISYAVYVIHGVLIAPWFGGSYYFPKYTKWIARVVLTFVLAHFSTFYFEERFIRLARRLTRKPSGPIAAALGPDPLPEGEREERIAHG